MRRESPSWDYVAALFDGEGGITYTVNHSGNALFRIHFSNKDVYLLERIREKVGGRIQATSGKSQVFDEGIPRYWQLWVCKSDRILEILRNIQGKILRRRDEVTIAIAYTELGSTMQGWPGRLGTQQRLEHDRKTLLRLRLIELFDIAHAKEKCGQVVPIEQKDRFKVVKSA